MGYELIEHTADVGLDVWASDLDGLFAEAARALIAVMGRGTGPDADTVHVDIDAPDLDALLVDWLSEVLYLFEVKGVVARDVSVSVSRSEPPGDGWRLSADVSGTDAGAFVQEGPAVKAVTYHAISVTADASGAKARVYLDV